MLEAGEGEIIGTEPEEREAEGEVGGGEEGEVCSFSSWDFTVRC